VSFTETTPFRSKKEAFLPNSENKHNVILMLRRIMDSKFDPETYPSNTTITDSEP
jgi:hypothetical protein